MKHQFEKATRIVADLLTWCHSQGAVEYHTHMSQQGPVCHCRVRCTVPNLSADSLHELRTELNRPRAEEMEQSYWGLSGETDTDTELTLVGMMVDEAVITYEGDQLCIHCQRIE